jgi:hypothetical protein
MYKLICGLEWSNNLLLLNLQTTIQGVAPSNQSAVAY